MRRPTDCETCLNCLSGFRYVMCPSCSDDPTPALEEQIGGLKASIRILTGRNTELTNLHNGLVEVHQAAVAAAQARITELETYCSHLEGDHFDLAAELALKDKEIEEKASLVSTWFKKGQDSIRRKEAQDEDTH
jgi:hypothetical protein